MLEKLFLPIHEHILNKEKYDKLWNYDGFRMERAVNFNFRLYEMVRHKNNVINKMIRRDVFITGHWL